MRRCLKCRVEKEDIAFVGSREICRACFNELSKVERGEYILSSLWRHKLNGDDSKDDTNKD